MGGWTYVIWPDSVKFFGTQGLLKVSGKSTASERIGDLLLRDAGEAPPDSNELRGRALPGIVGKKFLETAAQSDVDEIKLSQLAEQKAANPAVKGFAQKMVSEHEKMSASMKPFAESWGLNAPTDLDEVHKKDYSKLDSLSGADFDKQYIDLMVSDHSQALDAFTKEAKDTKDTKFRATVLKGKTMVAAHKNMAYDLKKSSSHSGSQIQVGSYLSQIANKNLHVAVPAFLSSSAKDRRGPCLSSWSPGCSPIIMTATFSFVALAPVSNSPKTACVAFR
jgi:putative membrane protein